MTMFTPRRAVGLLCGGALALTGLTGCDGSTFGLPGSDPSSGSTEATNAAVAVPDLIMYDSVAAAMADNDTPAEPEAASGDETVVDLASATSDSAAGVVVEGNIVRLTGLGPYRLTGSLDGQVVVDPGNGVVHVTLDGATIASDQPGALIVGAGTDTVHLHLADGSSSRLSDEGVSEETDAPEAALFSRADLVIDGMGALTVESADGDAIASTDGLVVAGGEITTTAGDDGLRGKDYLVVSGGSITATGAGDALKSTNTEDVARGYVLISGGEVRADVETDCVDAQTDALVSGGTLDLTCGDDGVHAEAITIIDGGEITIPEAVEGIEGMIIHLAGGVIDVTSSDDAVNAAGDLGATSTTGTTDASGDTTTGDQPVPPGGGQGMPGGDVAPSADFTPGAGGRGGPQGGGQPGSFPSGMPTDMPQPPQGMPTDMPMDMPTDMPEPPAGMPTDMPTDMTAPGSGAQDRQSGGQGGPGGGFGGFGGGMPGETVGAQQLLISGGTITLNAEGDGIDSNGTATMTGGDVLVFGPTHAGNGGLDSASPLDISGGTLVITDNGGMTQSPASDSEQAVLFTQLSSRVSAGASITVVSAAGETIAAITMPKNASTLTFSSPELEAGQSYEIRDGNTTLATVAAS
ncbi:MAG: carbohydrate-binding domain-containing protein [Propionibacteriaceae bacterium]|jgi:hypothetical protein|nr:carbohydrate-binding domain-containing protein [Propionibacteriaceae bacterium]